MIPTAIRRWTAIGREEERYTLKIFGVWDKAKIRNWEILTLYRWPHITIRWSPLSVAISRLRRRKGGK